MSRNCFINIMPSTGGKGGDLPVSARCLAGLYGAILLSLVGCASYERRPVDLATHEEAWRDQSLDTEAVKDYAERLADSADEGRKSFDVSDGISLKEAEAIALHFNPDLRVRRSQAQVPLVSAQEAGWWEDPSFKAEILRFANRGSKTRWRFDGPSLDGVTTGGPEATAPGYRRVQGDYIDDPWIVGASLSFTIPLSGRLAVEKDWAWAQYNAAWKQILIEEWQLVGRLQIAWLTWSTVQHKIELLGDYLVRLEDVADTTVRLAQAGELRPTESRVLQIEVARYRTDLQDLVARAEQERLTLFALLGLAPSAPLELVPQVVSATITIAPEDYRKQLLAEHPRIQLARAEYDSAEQQLRYEIRKQYPDLLMGPSYSFEEGFSRVGLGFGMPLPLWNHNRRAVAEAEASREAVRIQAEAVVEIVMNELAQIEARESAAQRKRDFLTQQVAPLVDRQVEDTRKLLGIGEVNVLVLRDALAASLETKLDVLDATLHRATASYALRNMLEPVWVSLSQAEDAEDKEVDHE